MNAPAIPENVQKLINGLQAPGPLRDAVLAQRATLDLPGLAALAKTHGIEVSTAELEALVAAQPVELTDADLQSVAGGITATKVSIAAMMAMPIYSF